MGRSKKIRITVGLEPKDYDALVDLSQEEERSLSWLVAQAVKGYLENRQAQYQLHFGEGRKRCPVRRCPQGSWWLKGAEGG